MASLEWLLKLAQSERGYHALLEEHESLAAAAWQVARARCRAWFRPEVPTRWEVHAAALEIATRVNLPTPTPPPAILASDCEAAGLPVV